MYYTLILTILALSLQNYIVTHVTEGSCNGKILQGSFAPNEKCFALLDSTYGIYKHKGDLFEHHFNCNHDCTACKSSYEHKYECTDSRISRRHFYGNPNTIGKKGFVLSVFPSEDVCKRNSDTESLYLPTQECFNQHELFQIKKANSIQLKWSAKKNGMVYKEYDSSDCKGRVINKLVFPSEECVKAPGNTNIRLRARKNV